MSDIEVTIRQASNGYIIVCSDEEYEEELIAYTRKEAMDIVNELFYTAENQINLSHLTDNLENEK